MPPPAFRRSPIAAGIAPAVLQREYRIQTQFQSGEARFQRFASSKRSTRTQPCVLAGFTPTSRPSAFSAQTCGANPQGNRGLSREVAAGTLSVAKPTSLPLLCHTDNGLPRVRFVALKPHRAHLAPTLVLGGANRALRRYVPAEHTRAYHPMANVVVALRRCTRTDREVFDRS